MLVPPALGWAADDSVGPPLSTYGAKRRLNNYKDGPLLFDIELVRVRNGAGDGVSTREADAYGGVQVTPYALPEPPRYFKAPA